MSPQSAIRVDAHHHVWQLARGDYGWLTPALAPIYRDFSLDDLRPLLREAGIGATVLVQAAPTEAETRFLLATASASAGLVRGVVGWVDCASPDAAERLTVLAGDPLLKSVRPMLQDIPDPEWILRPDVRPRDRGAAATRPALRRAGHARAIAGAAAACSSAIPISPSSSTTAPSRRSPRAFASRGPATCRRWRGTRTSTASCRDSSPKRAPTGACDSLPRYVDHLLACFGPTRLIWGSDWPVVDLAGGYRRWSPRPTRCWPGWPSPTGRRSAAATRGGSTDWTDAAARGPAQRAEDPLSDVQ